MPSMAVAVVGLASFMAVSMGYVGYYVFGASIDNALDLLNRRDLGLFRGLRVRGQSLGLLIQDRGGPCQWSATHREYVFATEIECLTRASGLARWELSHKAPRGWLPRQAVYVTPLNRVAASLVPELVPAGLSPVSFPRDGSSYNSGFVCDLANPGGNPQFGALLRKRGLIP